MNLTNTADLRWRRLLETPWKCSSCDTVHDGIFDLAAVAPACWPHEEAHEPNSAIRLDGDFLSEDFCIIDGKDFMIRGVLEIPLMESGGVKLGYGAWCSVSRENFTTYLDSFDDGYNGDETWFGWFLNELKGYAPSTYALKCQVAPQPNRQRPQFFLEPTDHPLSVEQSEGISYDRLLEIYALHGHRFVE